MQNQRISKEYHNNFNKVSINSNTDYRKNIERHYCNLIASQKEKDSLKLSELEKELVDSEENLNNVKNDSDIDIVNDAEKKVSDAKNAIENFKFLSEKNIKEIELSMESDLK